MITCSEPIVLAALLRSLSLTIPVSLLSRWMAFSFFPRTGKRYFRVSHEREATQKVMRKGP